GPNEWLSRLCIRLSPSTKYSSSPSSHVPSHEGYVHSSVTYGSLSGVPLTYTYPSSITICSPGKPITRLISSSSGEVGEFSTTTSPRDGPPSTIVIRSTITRSLVWKFGSMLVPSTT